jgi:NAD(P)-dependent dehydrogenase (short-subunit alcohol dehydrogenase family)
MYFMSIGVFRPGLFEGSVALVTGAGRGIGAGIAKAFLALGARTLLHDIDADALGETMRLAPRDCITGDLSEPHAAEMIFDRALEQAGRIDFLVNNAGRSWAVATKDIEPARTQELIELNLKSVLTLSRRLALHVGERGGGGSIVQISSTAGILGYQRRTVYCATKFAVIGITKAMALEHARQGLRVNAVLPHVVETEMFRSIADPAEIALWQGGIPMGRFATVEDIASLVVFLCSPAASYLTGGVYPVDGGATAGPYGGD